MIHLQSRKVVKAQEIADRFEISLRTVYRDVKTLEQAGIPLIGEAGTGYSLVDGYRLPPVMFSPEEAVAFITAEKLVSQLTDKEVAMNYSSAMYKIKAVLDNDKKEMIQNVGSNIEVFNRPGRSGIQSDLSVMQPILKSVDQQTVLKMGYIARYNHQHTERTVEPLGVFYQDNNWHLIAYCRMRDDYRDFRLDRISAMEVTAEPFTRKHPQLKDYLSGTKREKDASELPLVIIRVEKCVAGWLDFEKYYHGYISESLVGDELEMIFMTSSIEGFARWFVMFGDQARIISPDTMRDRVKTLLQDMLRKVELNSTVAG